MTTTASAFAPVVYFAYNRPEHTLQTLQLISQCKGSEQSRLYIYCDGAKEGATMETLEKIRQVRSIVRSKRWCGHVEIIEAATNKGLTRSISEGVTEIVNRHDKVIVVEDDVACGPDFLAFCNSALNHYESDDTVMHIGGFMYPHIKRFPAVLLAQPVLVWGWATWKRAWNHFSLDAEKQLAELKSSNLVSAFNLNDSYDNFSLLQRKKDGLIDTWDVCWYASVFLKKGLGVYPGESLVTNIGLDGTGAHWNGITSNRLPDPSRMDVTTTTWPLATLNPYVELDVEKAIRNWNQPGWYSRLYSRILHKLKRFQ